MAVGDTISIVIFLFVLSVSAFLGAVFLEAFSVQFAGTAGEQALTTTTNTMYALDNWFPYVMIGLFLVTIISAFFIDTHPIFLVFSLVLMGFGIIAAGAFTDMFNSFASQSAVSGVVNNFPGIVTVWQNMPMFVLFMSAGILVALYAKYRRGGLRAPQQ